MDPKWTWLGYLNVDKDPQTGPIRVFPQSDNVLNLVNIDTHKFDKPLTKFVFQAYTPLNYYNRPKYLYKLILLDSDIKLLQECDPTDGPTDVICVIKPKKTEEHIVTIVTDFKNSRMTINWANSEFTFNNIQPQPHTINTKVSRDSFLDVYDYGNNAKNLLCA